VVKGAAAAKAVVANGDKGAVAAKEAVVANKCLRGDLLQSTFLELGSHAAALRISAPG